jgi:hypothetical protein
MAVAIVRLAGDADARRCMGAAALRAAHGNTWGERARRLIRLYDSVTGRPHDTHDQPRRVNGAERPLSGARGRPVPRLAGQVVETET